MPEPNEVTVFSNGIADFRRRFQVLRGQEQVISLAYRRDHIGDVLTSLNIFGQVKLIKPPAYRYTNDGEPTLVIQPNDAIPSLLRSFSGAKVKVWTQGGDDGISGTILGLDSASEFVESKKVQRMYLGLYGEDRKLHRFSLDDITDCRFETDADNSEIAKALSRNYQSIKPESTFVDLTLGTLEGATEDAEAIVQSVIPLSAWKMTYRIECSGDKTRLEGLAIVDNNTDEDWKNFLVSVVTGEPNTFETDLATAKTPWRRTVNLVPESAVGGFQVAEGIGEIRDVDLTATASAPRLSKRKSSDRGGAGGYGSDGPPAVARAVGSPGKIESVDSFLMEFSAERDEAESSSVGEFQIFKSKAPVDIPAQSSALVPMFARELGDSRTILIYNHKEMPMHPFRAVRMVNDTGLNLNRGSCTVFREGVFSGQGILDNSKHGEVRLIPHSLELGVVVFKQSKPIGQRYVSIKISDGMIVRESASNVKTNYAIKNKLDEEFSFILEHAQVIHDSEMEIDGIEFSRRETIPGGIRFEFTLSPKAESTVVTVQETRLTVHSVQMTEQALITLIGEKKRIIRDPNIMEAMKIHESIEQTKRDLARQQAGRKAILEKQTRVQQLVTTARGGGSTNSPQANEWMKDLGESEKALRDLDEKTIPSLNAKLEDLYREIGEVLKSIKATWEAPATSKS